ncbi:MAG: hypothetical protein ACR2OC_11180 [Solirubrobacterales bacterium]
MTNAIDIPIERLPHVDEHVVGIEATFDQVWDALIATLPKSFGGPAGPIGGLLGVEHREAHGNFGEIGSTLPGFVVSRAVPPAVLALLGEHRFSRYALIFRLEKTGIGTALRAETRAEFPGTKGRVYRALVIGTRGHVLLTRRILGAVRKRAESG